HNAFLLGLTAAVILVGACWPFVTESMVGRAEEPPPVSVHAIHLETHVRTLSQSFVPRDESHPENLDRCAAYIRREFERANARVSEQPFTVDGKTYSNVIAHFGPETEEMFVVGEHFCRVGTLP